LVPAVAVAGLLGASSFIPALESPARTASIAATGTVAIATKPGAPTVPGTGTVSTTLSDVGGRVTPLPPRDQLELTMTVRGGGHVYDVRSSHAMIEDPLGRHTTWWGVGFDADHHGRSGIGSPDLPPVRSRVAGFGIARVRVDGRLVGTSLPLHVMTVDHGEIPGVGFAVDVGDVDLPLETAGGSMLRVTWPDYRLRSTDDAHGLRYAIGGVVLALLIGALVIATRRRDIDEARAG
jgi:hypothetical protein